MTETILDIAAVQAAIFDSGARTANLKKIIRSYQAQLDKAYHKKAPILELLQMRALLVDSLLRYLWQLYFESPIDLCLIAVGGYGRKELLPYSDIDILILSKKPPSEQQSKSISKFITKAWDIGLAISHSTRSHEKCIELADGDLSVYTNLLEGRAISGSYSVSSQLRAQLAKPKLWTNKRFYDAKIQEQLKRHKRFNETAHLLEPDIKNSPGTLRDIHQLKWFCLQFFQEANFSMLHTNKVLTKKDVAILIACEEFLLNIRYALHLLNHKDDNRLFFDKQLELSQYYNYQDSELHLAVEAFMKSYYLKIKEIRALSDIVTQYFKEKIETKAVNAQPLSNCFILEKNSIILKKQCSIRAQPHLLIQAFTKLSTTATASGFNFNTLRKLRSNLHLIDQEFCLNKLNQQEFIQLFKNGTQISLALQLMNRHGVLGKYLPEFEHVIGQTQHDLFHLYTVDQHTLFVLKKIDILKTENKLYKQIYDTLPKPELLYLAAFFHDIGKGRHTDHSQYGAKVALAFAQIHSFSKEDGQLLSWLVKQHLLLSQTAQKQDLNDENIIAGFTKNVKTKSRLDYLFLLTIADIQATNASLWNSWREALLKQLYFYSQAQLTSQAHCLIPKARIIQNQKLALKLLSKNDFSNEKITLLWQNFSSNYFIKESPEHIAWQTKELLDFNFSENNPLISIRNHSTHGAIEIFVCSKEQDNLFFQIALAIDKLLLNVVEAKITATNNGFSLDTFAVLTQNNQSVLSKQSLGKIKKTLKQALTLNVSHPKFLKRRIPRQLSYFCKDVRVHFRNTHEQPWTQLSIKTADQPGLLAKIGMAFYQQSLRVHSAKIVTLGDQVEDIFYISDLQNKPLKSRKQQIELRNCIRNIIKVG